MIFRKAESAATGKDALFKGWCWMRRVEKQHPAWAEAAGELRISKGPVKNAAQRVPGRSGKPLRVWVSQTVNNPAEVAEEIRCLFAALPEYVSPSILTFWGFKSV
jgi:hypothetical protein